MMQCPSMREVAWVQCNRVQCQLEDGHSGNHKASKPDGSEIKNIEWPDSESSKI